MKIVVKKDAWPKHNNDESLVRVITGYLIDAAWFDIP